MSRCTPCAEGQHLECAHHVNAACDCLVCIAERIGDMVLEDYPSHRRWRDDRDHAEAVERDYL